VDLYQHRDRSVGKVARDFDLTETAVREWVKQAERDAGSREDGGLTSAERRELTELRRENRTFATMRDLVAHEVWPSYFAPVIDLEATAIRIHEWEMRVVPGLLQTEDYARAVISAGKPRDTSAVIDRAVSARLKRQAILQRENPPMLWHVLHEGVLRHVVGSPPIIREQLDKLAELGSEPGVVIQILPFTASDHPGTDGQILVYDFDGASSVAYTECNGGGRIVESADEVGDLTMIVNMTRAAASPRRESARLIQQIRSELADA
jgi:hypothetical protein